MTLFIRSMQTMIRDRFRPKITSLAEPCIEAYRVLPIDIDVYRHMNHAKYLNYLEAARWGMMVRLGFFKMALKNKWITPIRELHIEYFRPLTLGQKFEIHSQFVTFEEKWFYAVQRFYSKDKEVARALIKGTVRKGKENIPPDIYLQALNFDISEAQVSDELKSWFAKLKD